MPEADEPKKARKEAWSFYRTISGVRLCWELEEPKGPKGPNPPQPGITLVRSEFYRGTALIRNRPPPYDPLKTLGIGLR